MDWGRRLGGPGRLCGPAEGLVVVYFVLPSASLPMETTHSQH